MFFKTTEIESLVANGKPLIISSGDNSAALSREFHQCVNNNKPFRLILEIGNARDDVTLFNGRVSQHDINKTIWEKFGNRMG